MMDFKEFDGNFLSTAEKNKVLEEALNFISDSWNPDACQFLSKALNVFNTEEKVTLILAKVFESVTKKDINLLYLEFCQEKSFLEALIQKVGSLELGPVPNAPQAFFNILKYVENRSRMPEILLKLSLTVADSMLAPESQEVNSSNL